MELDKAVQERLAKELQAAAIRQDSAQRTIDNGVIRENISKIPSTTTTQVFQRRGSILDRSELLSANTRIAALEKQVSVLHSEKAILETRCCILDTQVAAEKDHFNSLATRIEQQTEQHNKQLAEVNSKNCVSETRLEGYVTRVKELEDLLKLEKTRTANLIDKHNTIISPKLTDTVVQTDPEEEIVPEVYQQPLPPSATLITVSTQTEVSSDTDNAAITQLGHELSFYKTLHEQTMSVFKPGMKVVISGLQRSSEFNGKTAIIDRPLHEGRERGRILVTFGEQKVALKPNNINQIGIVSPCISNQTTCSNSEQVTVGTLVKMSGSAKVGIVETVEDEDNSCTVIFDSDETTHTRMATVQISPIPKGSVLFVSGLQKCIELNNTASVYSGILEDRILISPWTSDTPRAVNPCRLQFMFCGGQQLIKYMKIAAKSAAKLASGKLIEKYYRYLSTAAQCKYIRLRPVGIRKAGSWSFGSLQIKDPRGRIPVGITASCNITAVASIAHSGWSATTLGDRSWVRLLLPCGRRRDVSIHLSHYTSSSASESARLFAASRDMIPSEIIIESSFDGINHTFLSSVLVTASNASDVRIL